MKERKERHILALSGGKDSAALAVYMSDKYPELSLEYVFIDSGHELPETYAYLNKIRATLNIDINVIKPERDFDYWLKYFNGVLPAPNNRWCTKLLKLKPYREWLDMNCKQFDVYSYVGLRADEDREGFRPTTDNFFPRYPFINDGLVLEDIKQILHSCGLGLPEYYSWRNRSGCFFCFFQRDDEWRGLREHHPQLFEDACCYEENHSDGRSYTWRDAGSLRNLSESKTVQPLVLVDVIRPLLTDSLTVVVNSTNDIFSDLLKKE